MKLTFVSKEGDIIDRRRLPGNDVDYAIEFAKRLLRNEEVGLGVPDPEPVARFTVQNPEGATIFDSQGKSGRGRDDAR